MVPTEHKKRGEADYDPLRWLVQESASRLNEAGGEEEPADEDPESEPEESEPEPEESDDAESDATEGDDTAADVPEPFRNIELKDAFCFGWCPRAADQCWRNIADISVTKGWKNVDRRRLDYDLKVNVDATYYFLAQGIFEDLDTGYRWRARFVNQHYLWELLLEDGNGAEVLPEDAKAFFSSEYFKKFSKRAADLIARAVTTYHDVLEKHITAGELLDVDPVKAEAVLFTAQNQRSIDNFRGCKYELK